MVRMATLAAGGRITIDIVQGEVNRLRASWAPANERPENDLLRRFVDKDRLAELDRLDLARFGLVWRDLQT